MAKNLEITFLMDFYGEMLTEKQYQFLEYYYHDDLSLAEIAQNEGISRQGVRDAIKRAEAQLFQMESRLGLAERFTGIRKSVQEIIGYAGQIHDLNKHYGISSEIDNNAVAIKKVAQELLDSV